MKLIFLDIDGVLNSDLWYQQQKEPATTDLIQHLDPRCVAQLNNWTMPNLDGYISTRAFGKGNALSAMLGFKNPFKEILLMGAAFITTIIGILD